MAGKLRIGGMLALACASSGLALPICDFRFLICGVAGASTVTMGSIPVPANCALARNEHPRLLFTKADLPRIRQRIQHPNLEPVYQRLKKTVDDGLARGSTRAKSAVTCLGVLYQITGDAKYGQACREAIRDGKLPCFYPAHGIYGYDLVYDLLTPEERRRCEERILDHIKKTRTWRGHGGHPRESTVFVAALAIFGSGLADDYLAKKISGLVPWHLEHKKFLNEWAADRGGCDNSHAYIGQHSYAGTMSAFQAWRAATGQDWFDGFVWARAMAPYYVYHTLPGKRWTVNVGINSWGSNDAPRESGANNFTSIAQARWKCGLTSWWINNVVMRTRHDYHILGSHWGPLLWYEPGVPEIPPSRLPQDMLFRTRGYVCMRSDWSDEATFVHFHCGRFESDGRNQPDNNAFVIFRKAYLACDTGTRGLNNPGHPANDGWPGKHHELYFKQTIAHNTITVGTDEIHGRGSRAVCGGQVSRAAREWLARWGVRRRQPGLIVAYETHPHFCYAAGDARQSYSPDRVRAFTRQFLYVRPGAVVIFDRVSAVRPSDPKRWYLHTMAQPLCVDGELAPDRSVHPEGHFLAAGRTLRAPHGGSVLFSRTLLPEKAVIRVLGGKGHQFEVNGVNYDMSPKWWKNVGTKAYQERIGIGWWRVEVEPEVKQAEDLFLHVLWATEASAKAMFPVETLERGGQVGAKFVAGGIAVEVTFAKAGPVAGHIKLSRGGNLIADRSLASTVEDNYQQWRADPRFKDWTTNPHMRAVISPE